MKKRYWIPLTVALLIAAIVISVPLGIERYAETWLRDQGVADAAIGDIDLNLFTGTLLIEEITFSGTAQERGEIDLVTLNAQWTGLLRRRILLADVSLANAQLDIQQLADGGYRIGGLTIPGKTAAVPAEDTETGTPGTTWGFGLERVTIDNLEVNFRDPRSQTVMAIDQVTLDRLASWEPERRSELIAKLQLQGAAVTLRSSVAPFAAGPFAESRFRVTEFALLPYAAIFEDLGVSGVTGLVSIDAKTDVRLDASGKLALDVSGSVTLASVSATLPSARATAEQLTWSGDLAMALASTEAAPLVSGTMDIAASGFKLAHPEQPMELVTFDEFTLQNVVIESLDLIDIEGLLIRDLKALQNTDATTLAIADTRLDAIRVTQRNGVTVARAAFDGLTANIDRKADGKLEPATAILAAFTPAAAESPPEAQQAPAAGSASEPETESRSEPEPAAEQPETAFTFEIGVIEIGAESQVRVTDRTVSPPLTTSLKVNTLRVTDVRNDQPAKPIHVLFDLQQDDGATLKGEGELQVFGELLASDVKVSVRRFDLSQISSYVPGYHIDRGRLALDSHARLKGDDLDVSNKLRIEKLKLSGKAAGDQKMLGEGMAMPLDVALDMLRDNKDRIKLEIPVSGSLSDPKFGTRDVMRRVMQNALQKAAVSYVKNALQPLGTIMLVANIAGKAARPRFEPVTFAPGEAELATTGRAYLDKITKLLNERSGLSLTLCGVSTQADHAYLVAQIPPPPPAIQAPDSEPVAPVTETLTPEPEPAPPDFSSELLELAAARGNSIQEYFTAAGIKGERLLRCRPVLENNDDQPPRVEITL